MYQLIADVNETFVPITGLAESIIKGSNTPIKDCIPEEEVQWQLYRFVSQVYPEVINIGGIEFAGTVKIIRIWSRYNGVRKTGQRTLLGR